MRNPYGAKPMKPSQCPYDSKPMPLAYAYSSAVVPQVKPQYICPDCGRDCKSGIGLASHGRTHKR